jgi:hypothetical protein
MNDNALIEFVKQVTPDLIALYRFGSQTKGSARPESDVDLAVLAVIPFLLYTDLNLPRSWPCNCTVMWTSWIFAARPP